MFSCGLRRTFGSNGLPAGGEGIRTGGSTTEFVAANKAESRRALGPVELERVSGEYRSPPIRSVASDEILQRGLANGGKRGGEYPNLPGAESNGCQRD